MAGAALGAVPGITAVGVGEPVELRVVLFQAVVRADLGDPPLAEDKPLRPARDDPLTRAGAPEHAPLDHRLVSRLDAVVDHPDGVDHAVDLAPVAAEVLSALHRPAARVGRDEPVDDVTGAAGRDAVGVSATARVVVPRDQVERAHAPCRQLAPRRRPSISTATASSRTQANRHGAALRLCQTWLVPRWMTTSPARMVTTSPPSSSMSHSPSRQMP